MYKVLIIDDEKTIIQGLRVFINWEEFGFEIAGEAYNGQSGVELAGMLAPQLIITDIRMPLLSGLEVIEKVRLTNPECKFIILSGFSDFEYALEAINKGVCRYLLKPVQEKELIEVIMQIKEELDKKNYKEKEEENLKKQLTRSLPVLRERYLNEIVNDENLSGDEIIKRWKYLNIDYSLNKFCVLILEFDDFNEKYGDNIEDGLIMKFAVNNIIEEMLLNMKGGIAFYHSDGSIIVIYCESDNNIVNTDSVFKFANRVRNSIEKYLNETLTISAGGIYDNVAKLTTSFNEARKALEYKIIYGSNSFISINDIHVSESFFCTPFELEKKLIAFIQLGQKAEALYILDDIFNYIRQSPACKPESFYGVCADIIVLVSRNLSSYLLESESLLKGGELSLRTLFDIKTENSLRAKMKRMVSNSVDAVNKARRQKVNGTMKKIREYIESCYSEDITLDFLANKFYMNPNYLSQTFKKELGTSFVDFLTKTRVENAKKLLLEPDLKIYEVSGMVGYPNQRYFSQVFEKYSGLTPSEYRKKEGQFLEEA